MTCFFCGEGSKFDNQMKTMTSNVNTANSATVESADTVMSYFVSLICGERTGRIVRVPGFSAIDMRRNFQNAGQEFQATKPPDRDIYAAFYRIEGILTKNSTLSTEKTSCCRKKPATQAAATIFGANIFDFVFADR